MVIGALLLPALVSCTAFFINFIAMYYHASRAIPFGTMVRDRLCDIINKLFILSNAFFASNVTKYC